MSGDTLVFVYTTVADQATAAKIARALVERDLAACCNIVGPMMSVYKWAGEMTSDPEIALWIKTRAGLAEAAIEAARALHPYETPCFLTLPIAGADAPYLAWALEQTERPR
jgi:periplasmic divalent cation tolerance protein